MAQWVFYETGGRDGREVMETVFGLAPNGWLRFLISALPFAPWAAISAAGRQYAAVTGRLVNTDQVGFERSGGFDVGLWCWLATTSLVYIAFLFVVPPGMFGPWRSAVVIGSMILLARVLSHRLAAALYRYLYGPSIL